VERSVLLSIVVGTRSQLRGGVVVESRRCPQNFWQVSADTDKRLHVSFGFQFLYSLHCPT
jgi:hypothetical protein